MATENNLGRVQGGGFFGSTSTSETSIPAADVTISGVSPLSGDTIINANGAMCRVTAIENGNYTVEKYGIFSPATSEDTEAVHFTPQGLTVEQQSQARANISAQPAGDYATKAELTTAATAEVTCAHELELTGNTGDEHGLAIGDQQMTLTKIQGQTRRKSLNLFNIENAYDYGGANYGEIIIDKVNKKITMNDPDKYGDQYRVIYRDMKVIPGKKYCFSAQTTGDYQLFVYNGAWYGSVNSPYIFTAAQSNIQLRIDNEAKSTNIFSEIMLNEGNTPSPYAPFDETLVNAKCNFLSTGKNLWRFSDISTTATQEAYVCSTYVIEVLPNTQFSFSANFTQTNGNGNGHLAVAWIDSENKQIGNPFIELSLNDNSGIITKTINASSDASPKLRFNLYATKATAASNKVTITNVMFNAGNTFLPYEPYKAETLPFGVSLGQWDYWQENVIHRQTSELKNIAAGGSLPAGLSDGNFVCNVPGITTVAELTNFAASNAIQLVYKLSTEKTEQYPFAGGYAVYNGGLQQQVTETLPYILTKRYSLNVAAQLLANIEIDREQQAQIDQQKSALLSALYPVGAIYLSYTDTSPATLFGGTWAQIKDMFLLAAGSTYAAQSVGGSASHTLTVEEMPSHRHYTNFTNGEVSPPSGTEWIAAAARNTSANVEHKSSSVGGGQAFDIMPPYLAVYMWRRTA